MEPFHFAHRSQQKKRFRRIHQRGTLAEYAISYPSYTNSTSRLPAAGIAHVWYVARQAADGAPVTSIFFALRITVYKPDSVQSTLCCTVKRLPRKARCNCLPHPGKDLNAQHRSLWLRGQQVLTRRHVTSLPRCVGRPSSNRVLWTRKLTSCSTTFTWLLVWSLTPSKSSEAVLKKQSTSLCRNSVTRSNSLPSFTLFE
jgi:hypothetical protein